jgi:selenocysteine lyase/cysteine desulfurase
MMGPVACLPCAAKRRAADRLPGFFINQLGLGRAARNHHRRPRPAYCSRCWCTRNRPRPVRPDGRGRHRRQRELNVIRLATPLYNTFEDVYRASAVLWRVNLRQ